MTSSRHRFDASRTVEQRWTPTLDQLVQESYPLSRVCPVSLADELRGIDRFVIDDQGVRVGLEYKVDERWRGTGNAFFETVSNAQTGRPGWLITCQATWLLYFLTPSRVLVYWMPALRRIGTHWAQRYPIRPAHNESYDTLGVCVPVSVAVDAAESVSDLNHGDGLVLQRRAEGLQ